MNKPTTKDELYKMSRQQLVELYNANLPAGKKAIKSFGDKPTGVTRVAQALGIEGAPTKAGRAGKAKNGKAKAAKAPREPRVRKPFDLPAAKEITEARPNSKRAKVVGMLKDGGATVEEVMSSIGWNRRTALEGIRLVHKLLGYGLKETSTGKIHLVKS